MLVVGSQNERRKGGDLKVSFELAFNANNLFYWKTRMKRSPSPPAATKTSRIHPSSQPTNEENPIDPPRTNHRPRRTLSLPSYSSLPSLILLGPRPRRPLRRFHPNGSQEGIHRNRAQVRFGGRTQPGHSKEAGLGTERDDFCAQW